MAVKHKDRAELEAGLAHILESPDDGGEVQMIVRRPAMNEREILEQAELHTEEGLVGDLWHIGDRNPDQQLTIMNARVIDLLAGEHKYWPLAGDQLYVDMNLSGENLPPGTRLTVGSALLEVSVKPHTGCSNFSARYGKDALTFTNGKRGRELNLRGINTRIVRSGTVKVGDRMSKLADHRG